MATNFNVTITTTRCFVRIFDTTENVSVLQKNRQLRVTTVGEDHHMLITSLTQVGSKVAGKCLK